jgi:soluble lytic murein transglycosylase-like protein
MEDFIMKRFLAVLLVLFANLANAQDSAIEYIMDANPKLSVRDAEQIHKSVVRWATEFNIVPALLFAIIEEESNFVKNAFNQGAVGLMQVIPRWHKDKFADAAIFTGSKDVRRIDTNIYLGARVLHECKKKYRTIPGALTCYNGGGTRGYAYKVLSTKKKIVKEILI